MYHNTTQETKEKAELFNQKTEKQDEIVKRIINRFKAPFSTKDVYRNYPIMNTPLTSIRRSINTLKRQGFIMETGKRVMGLMGRSELQYTKA